MFKEIKDKIGSDNENVWGLEYHPSNIYWTHKILKINKPQRAHPCKPTAISASFQMTFVGPVRVILV